MQDLRYDQSPGAPLVWLMHSLMGALEVCIQGHGMSETEAAVGLQVIALRDTREALLMMRKRKLGKREKMSRGLLKAYIHKLTDNPLMRTWEKGLVVRGDKKDRLATDTTRFLHALNLISHPNTPVKAVSGTIGRYVNNVTELH